MNPRLPIHVTVRMSPVIARLRNFALCAVLRRAFVHGCLTERFRICHFSIQGNHVHLICEAVDNAALSLGMKGWAIRVARGLNSKLGRSGKVFEDRYHFEIVRTPGQCRAALCYVLQNARRHGERLDAAFNGMDPFSSAWWFDGWKDNSWRAGLPPPEQRTVAEPESWLLRVGWRRTQCASCAGLTGQPAMLDEFWCYRCRGKRSSSVAAASSISSQTAS